MSFLQPVAFALEEASAGSRQGQATCDADARQGPGPEPRLEHTGERRRNEVSIPCITGGEQSS